MHRSYRKPFWFKLSFCSNGTLTQVQKLCFESALWFSTIVLAGDPFHVVPFCMSQNIDAAFAQTVAQKHSALLTNDAPALYPIRRACTVSARLTTLQHAVCPHISPQEFLGRGYLWKPSLDGFSHPSNTSPPRYSKPNNPWFRNRSSCNKPLIGLSCLMLDLVSAIKFCFQLEDIRKQAGLSERQTSRV